MMLGEVGRNTAELGVDAVQFDPRRRTDRAKPLVTAFSYGRHQCPGRDPAMAFLTGLVKLAAGLKNLRPAPGEMGKVKTIRVGSEKAYLNDSWSCLGFDASSTLTYIEFLAFSFVLAANCNQ